MKKKKEAASSTGLKKSYSEGQFKLVAPFSIHSEQARVVDRLVKGFSQGHAPRTLMGVTGSGKTFVMAAVIEALQMPTLLISHNKTLTAQLYCELKDFFPHNAVEYFVSYYDYYQPEAYVPSSDVFIEKDASVNDRIDRLRLSATSSVLHRKDVLVVASVSCIYGLGSPEEYGGMVLRLEKGEKRDLESCLEDLVQLRYKRNDLNFTRGHFRVKGDVLDVIPSYREEAYRIEFFGDEIERICSFDPLTGEILEDFSTLTLYPAKHFVSSQETLDHAVITIRQELKERVAALKKNKKLLEAQRIWDRTRFDLEMLKELGFCHGIENYSRHFTQRKPGQPPFTLFDYFPDDFLLLIDESHVSFPQLRAMYRGDRSRKETLVEYGFRLPSALDNRPFKFEEFEERAPRSIYFSATPGPYELEKSSDVIELVIRPTGLLDPEVEVRPSEGQMDDLMKEISIRAERGERTLVTTLTKRMSEELSDYLGEMGLRVQYLHSDIQTLERIEILNNLRRGEFDCLVGINLLREGLDLPEVSLVVILDADKEGFLRSRVSLIQTMGRASRHEKGKVILYADRITDSMKYAIEETDRRRKIQSDYNQEHGITPRTIIRGIKGFDGQSAEQKKKDSGGLPQGLRGLRGEALRRALEEEMLKCAERLDFEKAAFYRDQMDTIDDKLL